MRRWIDPAADVATGALRGVRVLEIGDGISSAFAARLLGDYGASVVTAGVERPTVGPHAVSPELSSYLDWNKFDVAIRPRSTVLDDLLSAADVVIIGDDRDTSDTWGIDVEAWKSRRPDITVVVITPFGLHGPRSDWPWSELIVQAASGLMSISGTSDREPLMRGLRQSRYEAGLSAAYTAIAGVYAARRTGQGAVVDHSIAETVSSELVLNHANYMFLGGVQGRRTPTSDKLATGDPIPTADGFATVQVNTLIPPADIGRVFDEPRLADPKFATRDVRRVHSAELDVILRELGARYTAKDFFEKGAFEGLLTGFVQTADQLLTCSQLEARDTWVTVDVADGVEARSLRFASRLGTMSRTPSQVRRSPGRRGEHTDRVVAVDEPSPQIDLKRPTSDVGPLSGLRVLDLSSVFAVPYIGGLLADLGAEVIKIEPTDRLDQTRGGGFGPWFDNEPKGDSWNRSGTFQEINRGKRSLVLNLKSEEGRAVFKDLVRTADIVLDNFTPRVLRGWDLTYETLQQVNPRIIHLSNNGYGSSGPWSSFKAQGTTLEATMGISSVCGYAPDQPSKIGQSYPDFLATWSGLVMIMTALMDRLSTGRGQWIDLGMYQLGPVVIPEAVIAAQTDQDIPRPSGNRELGALFSTVVRGPRDGEWIAVSVGGPAQWGGLQQLVDGLPQDPPVTADDLRVVDALLTSVLADGDVDALLGAMRGAGVATVRVANARDLAWDAHLADRGFYETVDFGPEIGRRKLVGRPYRWAATHRVGISAPGASWGADTSALLKSVGRDETRIAELVEQGVTALVPIGATSFGPSDIGALIRTGVHEFSDPRYRDSVTFRSDHESE